MKKKTTNPKVGRALFLSAACLMTFAVSAGSVFFLLPQSTVIDQVGGPAGGGDAELTNPQRFVNQLVSTATSGITLDVENLDFVIPGATKTVNGEEVRYDNRISSIEGKAASISLALNELSLAGINLKAELPLEYNGLKRELNLGLLGDGETSKNLYFNIGDIDGDEGDWTAGYQVDVNRYVSEEVDPVTGGNISYEYGALDFVIHDILEILTEGGINVDTYGKIESLITGSGSSETAPVEEESSSSSISTDDILDALNTIVEADFAGHKYFTLDLPLGSTNLSIGLGADENLNLSHVDIPSALSGEAAQDLGNGMTLSLSATVKTAAAGETYDWSVPAAWASYPQLDDSLGLFRRIAKLVASPKFGLELDVDLLHKEEPTLGTLTNFSKEGVEEKARISLTGDVDLSYKLDNGAIKGVNFNSAGAQIGFASYEKDVNDNWVIGENKQMLSAYVDNSDSSNASCYLNFGDVLKASTTKTVLDEVIGKFSTTAESTSPTETVAEETTDAQLENVLDTVTKVIGTLKGQDDFSEPALIAGLKEQHYESILEMLSQIEIVDNRISIILSLDNVGFDGAKVILELNGEEANSLLNLRVENLELNTLTVDLSLKTKDFAALTEEERLDLASYAPMNRLPSLVDPIANIVDNKKASIALSGTLRNEGTMDVYGDPLKETGMDISGSINLDFSRSGSEEATNPALIEGGVSLTLQEHAKAYYQDHHVLLDIANTEEDFSATSNAVYFHYDSMNEDSSVELEARDNPDNVNGLNGKIHLSSAVDAIEPIISSIGNFDSRFERISRIFAAPAEANLISDLTSGNYFKIGSYSFLKEAVINGTNDRFVIDGSAFGMDGEIALLLNFDENKLENIGISLTIGQEGSATKVDLALSFEEVTSSTPFSFLNHEASFIDFTGIATLGDYLVSTLTLGMENGEGHSTYDLTGAASIALGEYEAKLAEASLQAYVRGAQTKLHGELNDIPVIRGLNAPDDPHYFRELEIGGQRDASFYYYSDGRENAEGELVSELLMTRHSDYGRLANIEDSVKLNKEGAFKDDALSYMLQYFLGVNEAFFAEEENSTEAQAEETTSRGLALHVEDIFSNFTKTVNDDGSVAFDIALGLNSLLGVNILDDVVLHIEGGQFGAFHALNLVRIDLGVSVAGDQGSRLSLLKAKVELRLNNLVAGQYLDGWEKGKDAFEANFLHFEDEGTYSEVGVYAEPTDKEGGKAWRHGIDEENKGHRNYYLGLSA